MNILEFFASIVDSVAWPAAFALLLVIFRNPVSQVLMRIVTFKLKGAGLDIQAEISELHKAESDTLHSEKEVSPKAGPAEPSKEVRPTESLEEAVEAVAQLSPEAAIPLAWSAVEAEVRGLGDRAFARNPDFGGGVNRIINSLRKMEVIDRETFSLIQSLRNLRNRTVHQYTPGLISPESATEYGQMAEILISKLRKLPN